MEKEVLATEWGETRTKAQSWGFGSGKEWGCGRGRVVERTGRRGEDDVPRWANKGRNAKERMRQVRRREEVTLDRVTLVRKGERPSYVRGPTRRQGRTIRQSEWD